MQIAKLFFIIITGAALLGGCGGSPAEDTIKAAKAWAKTNAKDEDGNTPLHLAAKKHAAAEAKRLIDNGAEVNAKGEHNYTPLHLAAKRKTTAVAELLIDNGAEVNAKGGDNLKGGEYGGGTPLHLATAWGRAEIAKLLIDNGANIEAKDNDGITPLHGATYSNAAEIAKVLIEKGAEVNAKVEKGDYAGWTPMDAAIDKKHAKMQSFLKQHGGECSEKC